MRSLALALALAISTRAQVPAAVSPSLKFEVASLKPSMGRGDIRGIRPAPGGERYLASNASLKLMLMVAYRLKADQIIGGPTWVDTASWDMTAKAERPSSADELHMMLQNLLKERFRLQFHHETKELPVYVLSINTSGDKSGPRMKAHQPQNAGDTWIDQRVEGVVHVIMSARFTPMDYLAWRLGQVLDRPVVDRTNLKGGYDFDLTYTRELPPNIPEGALINGNPIDTGGPTIFAALKQQLGLKLEPQKAPVEIMVIDRAEKPAEN
ncbi:MAG TPA: TIGR03435 family protein [Bryobacteraceae bacterium]|nr:TIGR03435 family protein [Bryobacteraceae bacterium]